jgi:hypothetical protein
VVPNTSATSGTTSSATFTRLSSAFSPPPKRTSASVTARKKSA